MITGMCAKNFKSWKDTGDLRIAPLTGFFGSNSSGKTSLLQMLLLMKQTAEFSDQKQVLFFGDENSPVNLGTFYDLIFNHQTDNKLELSLTWIPRRFKFMVNEKEDLKIVQRKDYDIDEIKFTVSIGLSDESPVVEYVKYQFDDKSIVLKHGAEVTTFEAFYLDTPMENLLDFPSMQPAAPVKFYGFPGVLFAYSQTNQSPLNLIDFVQEFESALSKIVYLGHLRDYPERFYAWSGDQPSDVGKRGERAISAMLAVQNGQHSIEHDVARWLQKTGLIHSFKLNSIGGARGLYEILVQKTPKSAEVRLTDVGFGVSQILPVLVLCYYVPEGSTIIFEQPEIHLHPSVQADLADVFIEVIKERRIQIIFESHSEYLLHRIQRHIAEENLDKDTAALYFCSMGEEASQIDELRLDEYGNIANWPPEFFGDVTGDLIKMTEAAMRRQIAGQNDSQR